MQVDQTQTLGAAARAPVVVHDSPGRLRLRAPLLGLPSIDVDRLAYKLRATPGVNAARINPDAFSVIITYDGRPETRARALTAIKALSHTNLPQKVQSDDASPTLFPVVARLALLIGYGLLPPALARSLALVAIAPRVVTGLRSLLAGGITVEVLDALAVSLGALRGQYRTALTTDFMMGTGEFLEETTMRHSSALLQDMLMPNPDTAWIEGDSGSVEVPFQQVKTGDTVVVTAGGLVPVDGKVRSGSAQVNQASITGESLPVGKAEGDSVIAGSLVESGQLHITAEKVGDDTTTAQIARMIHESLDRRSNTERLAQKHADRQVFVTLGLGAVTLALTRDLRRLSSVFLVDYACPIKLSAPVAVRATMSDAVSRGILIKGGPIIEKLADADVFVFDKTGTLTHGSLTVTEVHPCRPGRWSAEDLLAMAASLEEHASHPVARAIVAAARSKGADHIAHGDVEFDVGHGVVSTVNGKEVLIGSRHFLEEIKGVDFSEDEAAITELSEAGNMLLYLAIGMELAGLIGVRDELREDAVATAARLRALGVRRLVMLTGDRRMRAEAYGRELGFDEVHADLRPDDKLQILRDLRASGDRIAFVGDGANDAPALAEADVGIGMSQGADIAVATADIALLDDRLEAVADARATSVQAMRVIGFNNSAALGINSGLFLAASLGMLSPVAAAMMHNGSTLALLISAISRAGLGRAPHGASES
ncbi:MAG: heavy metal translocating P-type ATPase [Pseudomonadota bacterium]